MGEVRRREIRERVSELFRIARASVRMCPRPTAFWTHFAQMKSVFGAKRKTAPALPRVLGRMKESGQVAERSKAADCKSADPCGLRRFEPSPVHQLRH